MSAISFGVTLALAMVLAAGGYWAGDHNRNNACQAAQTTQALQAGETLLAEALRGQDAATQSITGQQALQKNYSTLENKFNELNQRGPLAVFRDDCCSSSTGGGGHADGSDGPGEDAVAGVCAPQSGEAAGLDLGLDISRGALWVWNSALTGQDSPAGACGAADTSSKACAVGAGISLEATWANHVENAKSCAQDRLRHQQLIDYIKGTPQ